MALLRHTRNRDGSTFPWDVDTELHASMPDIEYVRQSNTVTLSVLLDRMTGKLFPLSDEAKVEHIRFSKITQTVQDQRFRSQRLLNLQDTGDGSASTILISLTGVIVTTGSRSSPSAVCAIASTTRIVNTHRVPGCRLMCHANMKVHFFIKHTNKTNHNY